MRYLQYNEKTIPQSEFYLSNNNRAFLYGDGVFETIIVRNHNILFLEDHFIRLCSGLSAFEIIKPSYLTKAFLKETILSLVIKNNLLKDARVKINLWRKPGGLFTPLSYDCDLMITAEEFIPNPSIKSQACFYENIKKNFSSISKFKTLNSAPYILASIKKSQLGMQDMIMLDSNNAVSECTTSNIFFIKDQYVYTPSLECACIEGILRKKILQLCIEEGIEVNIGQYNKSNLLEANYVFTSNVAGLSTILQINERVYNRNSEIFDLITLKLTPQLEL